MARYRDRLPQLDGRLFLTDGGIETTLIFHEGLDLPDFAAFHLLKTPEGEAALRKYFRTYADIARRFRTGLVLESATWRASADWGGRLGYAPGALADANRRAIELLEELRGEYEAEQTPVVISGCVGPRGDGYVADAAMSPQAAEAYHREQIETFADTAADMVCAITMNYAAEAIGVVRAAKGAGVPVAVSFTVETDGRLPTGQTLRSAIEEVDAATDGYAAYFAINCAHPAHFDGALDDRGAWLARIQALRANASRKSHVELNESAELDVGDPAELGDDYARLTKRLNRLNVMGGCCGTDHRHVGRIAEACAPLFHGQPHRAQEAASRSGRLAWAYADARSAFVRPARAADASVVADLTRQLGYDADEPAVAARLARILARADQQVLVAESGGRVIGWVHAEIVEYLEADPVVVIGGLVVDAGHRGTGIGRALMQHAETWARDRGCSMVRLWSSATRTGSHRFYERLGYVNVKTQYAFAKSLDRSGQDQLSTLVPRVSDHTP